MTVLGPLHPLLLTHPCPPHQLLGPLKSILLLSCMLFIHDHLLSSLIAVLNSMGSSWYPVPPNAPLLKDSDSFTDGTGHSTFDFPLPSDNPEINPSSVYPLIYHPTAGDHSTIEDDDDEFGLVTSPTQTVTYTNSLALDLLPHHDREVAVRDWVEGVSAMSHCRFQQPEDSVHPRKRRRSLTASSEAEARRVRAWIPTVEPSHAPQPTRKRAYPSQRKEPEAPD